MSDTMIDPSQQTAPENTQGQADGSPPESGSTPTSEVEQGAGSDGSTPAESVAEAKPQANDEMKSLRQKLTEQGEQIAGFTDLFNVLKSDPDLWGRIEKTVRGTEAPVDPVQAVLNGVDDLFEEGTAKALKPLLAQLEKAMEQKFLGKMAPALREATATAFENKVASGLKKAGVDPSVGQSEDFKVFAREHALEKPWIKSVLRDDPVSAYELLGKAYAEATGLKRQIHNEASRREGVRLAASMEQRGSKAGPTASTVNNRRIPRNQNTLHAIMEQIKQGVDPGSIVIE